MFQKKKKNNATEPVNPKIQTAQEFINVETISDDMIYSRDGYIFGFLSVRASDNQLLSDIERRVVAQNMTAAMDSDHSQKPFQILSVPRTVDIMGMLEYMDKQAGKTRNDSKLRLIEGEIHSLNDLRREGVKEPRLVIKIWEQAERGADLTLKKRLSGIRAALSEAQIAVEIMNTQQITNLCVCFADLTSYQPLESYAYEDIPILADKQRRMSMFSGNERRDAKISNEGISNLITPIGGLKFEVSKVLVGGVVGRIYGATRYGSEMNYGWAVELVNSSNCVTCITYYPGNPSEMADALARSVKQNAVDAEVEGNARRRQHLEKKVADSADLIGELEFKQAPVGHISILAMPFADSPEELEKAATEMVNRFARKRIKMKPLGNLQKEAYKHLSPYYPTQAVIDDALKRLCPLDTLMGGFPMTINLYRDDRGTYFARTLDGSIMSIDMQYRGHDRTSSNAVFTGMTGMGKSTAVKSMIAMEYMKGVKFLIIDPEREFREMCQQVGGTWLDIGGGGSKINPFQIRPVPEDDDDIEDDRYRAKENAMAQHIRTLDVFFHLYLPSLTDYQRGLLKEAIIAVYGEKGITWETNVLDLLPEDYPIVSDLVTYLRKQSTAAHQELAVLLSDMATGADSYLWNGPTNVNINSDFIVFDTQKLQNNPNEVKRAQYFNALTLCWQIMSADRTTPVFLVCDEGHILFDPEIPQTSMYLRNYAKRARKYEGALWLVTQSLVDLLNEKVKLYGQAILDQATYKVFFGTDGKNLQESCELYQLTDAEKNVLLAQQQRHALFIMGKQRIHVVFDLPKYRLDIAGRGGGR